MASNQSTRKRGTCTMQERNILKLVAEGYKDREIAQNLKTSITTVERSLKNLMRKLNCRDVSSLLDRALGSGLISVYEILESRFSKRDPEREFTYEPSATPV